MNKRYILFLSFFLFTSLATNKLFCAASQVGNQKNLLYPESQQLGIVKLPGTEFFNFTITNNAAAFNEKNKISFTSFNPAGTADHEASKPITALALGFHNNKHSIAFGQTSGETTILSLQEKNSLAIQLAHIAVQAAETVGTVLKFVGVETMSTWAEHKKEEQKEYSLIPLITIESPGKQLGINPFPIRGLCFAQDDTLVIATNPIDKFEGSIHNETLQLVTDISIDPKAFIPTINFHKQDIFPCRESHGKISCDGNTLVFACNAQEKPCLHIQKDSKNSFETIELPLEGFQNEVTRIATSGKLIAALTGAHLVFYNRENNKTEKLEIGSFRETNHFSISPCSTQITDGNTIYTIKVDEDGKVTLEELIKPEDGVSYFFTQESLLEIRVAPDGEDHKQVIVRKLLPGDVSTGQSATESLESLKPEELKNAVEEEEKEEEEKKEEEKKEEEEKK